MSTHNSRQPAFAQHVRVSSTEDVSYSLPSTGSAGTNDVIQTIVTGRKCWKTIKGKGEVVWPPYLEAALIEGLEKYRPVETRSTRALGRYPMRNKFISDYIYDATGKRRTPKQVGSRLQQLRDTCEGKRILKLLASRSTEAAKAEEQNKKCSAARSRSKSPPPSPPTEYVPIDVLPSNVAWSTTDIGAIPCPGSSGASTSASSTGNALHIPRPLRAINPTVTFKSGSPLSAQSSFRVLQNGSVVHTETSDLELCSSSCMPAAEFPSDMECTFLYSTTLVPGFWSQLCDCLDLSPYSIVQDIIPSPAQKDSGSASSPASQQVMLSIVYTFNVHNTRMVTTPRSPTSSLSAGPEADHLSFSSSSTPELGGEFDDMFNSLARQQVSGFVPPPIQTPSYVASSYDAPPDLIRDGEEGYNSLPQSPLDYAFPTSITSGMMAGDPAAVLPQTICRSYLDETQVMSAHPSCFNDGIGYSVTPMLSGMSYQTFCS